MTKLYFNQTIGIQNLNMNKFCSEFYFPVPPRAEQEQIVKFLDYKTSQINRGINLLLEEIERLKELKQAIITRAVTRGLDPNTPLQDSQVPWIGKIPQHWKVKNLKEIREKLISGAWGDDPRNNQNDRICLRVADFDYNHFTFKKNQEYTIRNYTDRDIALRSLQKGDLLIEKSGGGEIAPVGRVVVYNSSEPVMFANFMSCVRLKKDYNSYYVNYIFAAMYAQKMTKLYFNQTIGIQNLNMNKFCSEFYFPVPPKNEQNSIVKFLDKKCSDIDALIAKRQEKIDGLKELKISLIADSVTGKLDVRGVSVPEFVAVDERSE